MEIILKYFSDFTNPQLEQLRGLENLYKEWNSKINVISRKDIDGLYEKHVLHSLSIAAAFDFAAGTEIIDIGTGGGFPGIPLAIFFPEVKFHLVDSIGKKLKVVESIAKEIGLTNVTTQHTRAEEIRTRKFDFAVSRAVAPLADLWKWSTPLLKEAKRGIPTKERNGNLATSNRQPASSIQQSATGRGLICLKGGDLTQEIRECKARPRLMEIFEIFPEAYFRGKYILHIPKSSP